MGAGERGAAAAHRNERLADRASETGLVAAANKCGSQTHSPPRSALCLCGRQRRRKAQIAATAAVPMPGSKPSRLRAQGRREGQSRGAVRRSGVRPEPPSRGVAAETIAVLDPLIEKAASRRCATEGVEQRRRHAVIDIFPGVAERYEQGARPIVIDDAIDRRTLVEPVRAHASTAHGARQRSARRPEPSGL